MTTLEERIKNDLVLGCRECDFCERDTGQIVHFVRGEIRRTLEECVKDAKEFVKNDALPEFISIKALEEIVQSRIREKINNL